MARSLRKAIWLSRSPRCASPRRGARRRALDRNAAAARISLYRPRSCKPGRHRREAGVPRPSVAGRSRRGNPAPGTVRWRVGRAAPLEALDGVTQRMLGGETAGCLHHGRGGHRQTTFIEMAIERLPEAASIRVCGRCTERFGTDEAFHPLIDALMTRCRGPGGPHTLDAIRAHAPTWLLQMPSFVAETDRAAFQNEVFGATRERMLREFCDLVEVLSADRPVGHRSRGLALERLGDAGRLCLASREVIAGLRRFSSHPIARAIPSSVDIPSGGCIRIWRFTAAAANCGSTDCHGRRCERHLALRFGDEELASALSEPLFGRTQGQPLFVASLLDYFVNQRVIFEVDGAWRLGSETAIAQDVVPSDLINMITHRLDRLTEDERQLLEVASVAGAEFSDRPRRRGIGSRPLGNGTGARRSWRGRIARWLRPGSWNGRTARIREHTPSTIFCIRTCSISD